MIWDTLHKRTVAICRGFIGLLSGHWHGDNGTNAMQASTYWCTGYHVAPA